MGLTDYLPHWLRSVECVAEITTEGEGVAAAELEEQEDGYQIILEFSLTVGKDNNIAALNILQDGSIVRAAQLYAGESKYSVGFDSYYPDEQEFDVVLVDDDDQVQHRDTVQIRKY